MAFNTSDTLITGRSTGPSVDFLPVKLAPIADSCAYIAPLPATRWPGFFYRTELRQQRRAFPPLATVVASSARLMPSYARNFSATQAHVNHLQLTGIALAYHFISSKRYWIEKLLCAYDMCYGNIRCRTTKRKNNLELLAPSAGCVNAPSLWSARRPASGFAE